MEDLPNLLHRDYGLKQQGKSAPMSQQRNTAGTGNMAASSVYDDVFGGPPKFTAQSFQEAGAYDDIFRSFSAPIKNSSVPVFDTPVYDDDIFGGLKGVKSSGVPYDDVFSGGSVAPIGDLVGENSNLGNRQKGPSSLFDDLIPGLSVEKSRSGGESRPKHRLSTASSQKPSKDSFVVPDPDLSSNSASTFASNSLEQLNVSSIPMSTKESKVPDNSTRGIDEINTFDGYPSTGRVSSSPMNKSRVAKSPLETSLSNSPHTSDNNELVEGKAVKRNSMISNFVRDHSKPPSSSKVSSPRRHRQPLHENSTYVTDLGTSRLSPLKKSEKGTNAVTERLVTVDEIKLRTKPSMLPPPSRPPPPLVIKQGPSKKMLDLNAGVNSNVLTTHRLKSGKSSKYLTKELEDSASGGSRIQHRGDKSSILMDGMVEGSSAAAASTAAMKEAMERAEVRLKLAKEARERKKGDWEREAKTAKFHEKEKQNRGDERITRDDWELDEREGVVKAEEALQQEEKEKAAKRVREAHQREEKEKAAKAAREREEKEAAAKAARMAREREQREREEQERERRHKEREREREEREREQERDREREREREREKDRIAVERATKEARERAERAAVERAAAEARERAAAEAREKSERAAFERAAAEARERAAAEAKERAAAGKSVAAVRERAAAAAERAAEARIRAERAASERAIAEARERAAERASAERVAAEARERTAERAAREARERVAERASAEKAAAEARERAERAAAGARERQRRNENDLEAFFGMGVQAESASRQRTPTSDATSDAQSSNKGTSGDVYRKATAGTSHNYNRSNVSAKTADDWMSSFNVPSSEEFQEIPGESSERRRARLERHQRTRERAAKALAEKNDRDLQVQREQAERHRLAETLDADVKRWATGKEGNLRALLSTLQYILWPESGWQPVSLTDIITAPAVKKVYRKATLCVHPDKVQQKGATIQQKYVAEKVFDLLKEAWNKFNSEELF